MALGPTVQSTRIMEYHDCNQWVHHSVMHRRGKHRNPSRPKTELRGNEGNRAVQGVCSNPPNAHSGPETSPKINLRSSRSSESVKRCSSDGLASRWRSLDGMRNDAQKDIKECRKECIRSSGFFCVPLQSGLLCKPPPSTHECGESSSFLTGMQDQASGTEKEHWL